MSKNKELALALLLMILSKRKDAPAQRGGTSLAQPGRFDWRREEQIAQNPGLQPTGGAQGSA